MSRWNLIIRTILFGTLAVVALVAVGTKLAAGVWSDYSFFDPLIDVRRLVVDRHVDEADEEAMQSGAIRGMLEALNDPHTVYVPASERRDFDQAHFGQFVGIGAQISIREGWLTIVTPLDDSPAFKAGLMADDRVVEIDGQSTRNITIEEARELLLGEPGTTVELLVERNGSRKTIKIVRDQIQQRAVRGFRRDQADNGSWRYIIDPNRRVAYIRLSQFLPDTTNELRSAVEAAKSEADSELAGLILDVRWNPGGTLDQAVEVADLFLDEGVIVSTRGRAVREQTARASRRRTLDADLPLVVLVNQGSASASEILAGALQDHERAVVVGSRTNGKGSVQNILTLPSGNGAQLKLTEQLYYLPSGRSIERRDDSPRWGIDPSPGYFVPMTSAQQASVQRERQQREIIRPDSDTEGDAGLWSDPDRLLEELEDEQLAAAIKAFRHYVDDGEWVATGREADHESQVETEELRSLVRARDRMLREIERVQRRIEAMEAVVEKPEADLWDDETDVTGGRLKVYNADGELIQRLRITGPDLRRWLIDAGVEPVENGAERR